jgi:hypothetical protein
LRSEFVFGWLSAVPLSGNGWWGFQGSMRRRGYLVYLSPCNLPGWWFIKGSYWKSSLLGSSATRVWICSCSLDSPHAKPLPPDRVTMSAFVGKYAGSCWPISQSTFLMPLQKLQSCWCARLCNCVFIFFKKSSCSSLTVHLSYIMLFMVINL